MEKLGNLIKNKPIKPKAEKLPAHHFQQVALEYLEKMNADRKDYGRVMAAVKRNPSAAATAFESTMISKGVTNRALYFLDLFNRAAGRSKKG